MGLSLHYSFRYSRSGGNVGRRDKGEGSVYKRKDGLSPLYTQHHDTRRDNLRLYDRPVEGHLNKFVIIEGAAYFVPCPNKLAASV